MSTGKLNLARCTPLVDRYKELIDSKSVIENKVGLELVNACFPDDIEECRNLRDISLGILNEDMTPEEMFKILVEKISKPEIPQNRFEIHIMSLHKSKGLEADLIIIPSCVEGLMPRIDEEKTPAEQQQELEEARRLFYVGITRTKKSLILSSFLYLNAGIAKRTNIKHRIIRKGLAMVQSSTFLRELGSSCPTPIRGDKFL
jgi:superfamily I DNA/RNA helicase